MKKKTRIAEALAESRATTLKMSGGVRDNRRITYAGDHLAAGDETTWAEVLMGVACTRGNVTHLAAWLRDELGYACSVRTVQRWRDTFPELARAVENARDASQDIVACLDGTDPQHGLQLGYDGEQWKAVSGERQGQGLTPTLAISAMA